MAATQNSNIDRMRRHIAKKFVTTVHGLRWSALCGRLYGPRVLLNSIPKSGTHLVESLVESLPLMRNAGQTTLSCWDACSENVKEKLLQIGNGEFLNAHLTGLDDVLEIVESAGLRVLIVVRDPRDVVVSTYHYVRDIDKLHPAHKRFAGLSNHDALTLAIQGGVEFIPSIFETLTRFKPWLKHKSSKIVRFEYLSPVCAPRARRVQELKKIADHLDLNNVDPEDYIESNVNVGSSTFRKGKSGEWHNEFSSEHIELFKKLVPESLLYCYGYGW